MEAIEFRKNRITNRKEEATVEATVLDNVERYLTIEDLVGAASAAWTPPLGAPFPVRSLEEAEAAAARLRTCLLYTSLPDRGIVRDFGKDSPS